jgi:hypothetical protein
MLVLHCTQMCLSVASADTSGPVSSAPMAKTSDAPCHAPDAPVSETSSECSGCSNTTFLESARSSLNLSAATTSSLPLCYLTAQSACDYAPLSSAYMRQLQLPPLSFPNYLTFSRLLL